MRGGNTPKLCGIAVPRRKPLRNWPKPSRTSPEDRRLLDRLAEFRLMAGQLAEAPS